MGNIGGGELILVLLVALVVLGPQRLPGAMREVGKVVGELRRVSQGFKAELDSAARMGDDDEVERKARQKGRASTAAPAAAIAAVPTPAPDSSAPAETDGDDIPANDDPANDDPASTADAIEPSTASLTPSEPVADLGDPAPTS